MGELSMPRDRVTFLLETPLAASKVVNLDVRSHTIVLLFTRRVDLHFTYVRTVVEADNWIAAIETAEEIITPALDVISLNRKVPMMLHPAVEVLNSRGRNSMACTKNGGTNCAVPYLMVGRLSPAA